jgi:hypothetical protein
MGANTGPLRTSMDSLMLPLNTTNVWFDEQPLAYTTSPVAYDLRETSEDSMR